MLEDEVGSRRNEAEEFCTKVIIDFLTALGERDKHVVLVGGGPTSKEWADKIGADGWGPDATSAVRLVEEHSGVRGG